MKLGGLVIMICLIPILLLLVTFNFIKYEQTTNIKNMKVAVVNQDRPANFKGKQVAVGQQVLKTLRNDHQVDWQFVSAKEARQNLASGRYAMQVVLPKDFSKNATTALDKSPKVSLLKIEASQKNNYLAGMITTQVVNQMKGSVVQKIQEAYNQALLGAIGTLGSGVQEASTGVQQLNTAAGQLSDGSQQIYDNLNVLHKGTQQLVDGSAPLQSGVQQLTNGSSQLSDGLQTLAGKTEPLQSGVQQLTTGGSQLSTGLQQLASKTEPLQSGVQQLTTGLSDYTNGASQINGGLNQLAVNNQSLIAGGQQINGGVNQLTAGTQQLREKLTAAADEIETSLNDNGDQLIQLKSGLDDLNNGIQALDQKVNHSNNDNSEMIKADLLKIADNTKEAGALLQDSGTNLSQINDKVYNANQATSVASSLQDAGAQLQKLNDLARSNMTFLVFLVKNPEIRSAMEEIGAAAKNDLMNAGNQLQSSGTNMKALQANLGVMGSYMSDNGAQLQAVSDELAKTADNMAQLKAGIAKMASQDQAPLALNGATQAIDTLTAGLAKVDIGLKQKGNTADTMGGIQAADMIHDGLTQIQVGLKGKTGQLGFMPGLLAYLNGVSTATAGSNQLVTNNQQLVGGMITLNGQTPALVSGVQQLNVGGQQLNGGLQTLNGQTPVLVEGVQQLNNGGMQLKTGLQALNQKTPTLIAGIQQLNDGSSLLASGVSQLNSGLSQAGAGISLLNVKLIDGSKQVTHLSTGSANVAHFVQPVKDQLLSETSQGNLVNTFAPLVLTLVFFVGGMLTQLTLYRYGAGLGMRNLKQRMLIVAGIIVAQALLVDVFASILGLTIAQPIAFFGLSILTSAAFTLACLALDQFFGTLGILIAFGLLFLQLIITGGLFPNDMLSGFYRGVAIFLPGTYTISGFEQVINGNGSQLGLVLIILIFFCAIFFAGLFGSELKQKLTQAPNSQA
ncbi:YhgE/Pip domain-containing protein [Latilactobacillus graminis]|uniref:YhgE Pip N-terminal domain protein n=2 Tax=Latilactobacillus graminis TaxID=60519 RepID=A0AA89I4G5_9LACO|nr:YhgE/Pip domain-containing protein [Latilactobacillus graminis]KRM24511.1 yhgE Pip N-terminal domain protein [Latilactobacillus graminis DSM 20719]